MGKIDTLPVAIPAEFLAYVENAVAGGEFASVEQVVESALRAWQAHREADLAKLRALIDEGYASGIEPWDGVDAILAEGRRILDERRG